MDGDNISRFRSESRHRSERSWYKGTWREAELLKKGVKIGILQKENEGRIFTQ